MNLKTFDAQSFGVIVHIPRGLLVVPVPKVSVYFNTST
jgi:hypothetical protein